MKYLIAFLFVPSVAFAQNWPSAYPNNPQPFGLQYPQQPNVVVVAPQPQNNLQANIQMQYQLEATRNLQLRNQAIEQQQFNQLYGQPSQASNEKGQFEIIGR